MLQRIDAQLTPEDWTEMEYLADGVAGYRRITGMFSGDWWAVKWSGYLQKPSFSRYFHI